MRSLRVIAICVVVAIGAFPADARTSEVPRPDRWTGPTRSGLQVLADARGRRMDAAALQRFQREIIAADSDAALADGEFVFPSRAGDLDGDAKQDVLTFEFAGDGSPEIVLASLRFVDESIRGAAHAVDPAGMLWSSP